MLRQSPRTFVERLDFRTTPGTAVSHRRHRPRHPRAARPRARADADRGAPRASTPTGARGDRLGPARRRRAAASRRRRPMRSSTRCARFEATRASGDATSTRPTSSRTTGRRCAGAVAGAAAGSRRSCTELTGPVFGEDAVAAERRGPHPAARAASRSASGSSSPAACSTTTAGRSRTRWSRSGRRTPPAVTCTRSTSIPPRSTRTSPAPAVR